MRKDIVMGFNNGIDAINKSKNDCKEKLDILKKCIDDANDGTITLTLAYKNDTPPYHSIDQNFVTESFEVDKRLIDSMMKILQHKIDMYEQDLVDAYTKVNQYCDVDLPF